MQNIILILSILGIQVLAWFTVGPQFVLIVRNSLIYSRKTGIWTGLGFAIGNSIHIIYSVITIAFVTSVSPASFLIIKYLGVIYLTYLGIKTILAKTQINNNDLTKEKKASLTKFQAIKLGIITNILNPKAPLFFVSIFGVVISAGSPWWLIIFLMITMPMTSFLMASMWAVVFSHHKTKSIYNKHQSIINKFLGATLIILAIFIALYK